MQLLNTQQKLKIVVHGGCRSPDREESKAEASSTNPLRLYM